MFNQFKAIHDFNDTLDVVKEYSEKVSNENTNVIQNTNENTNVIPTTDANSVELIIQR